MAGLNGEAVRFLACGGFAAFVNWAARIALSAVMPFEAAVVLAYVIGMVVGFTLYRTVVWTEHEATLSDQLIGFVLVNALSALVVFGVAIGLRTALAGLAGSGGLVDAAAHGLAIGIGAVANFVGHRSFTFKPRATGA
ncbi:GtrA family protein [Phreatobacter stygius]|uniref:GtrA family protein n=1 Tax=Phreatobacter stygius TaxID=1940610 RepID=A0A4D7BBN7_9HYPH|nr:GtrA family protein [Phreatobacter stygius]QCI68140.1 GtrA family protein [Phreatobacter stygius]